ncbi:MAG: AsmA-like C-terminal domain-containing protein [Nitrospirota bacterium]|nr:AsmA-like C-terminal domain-containing protein [Nitrospirota bacterium]MDE3241810.1 AsmA-like C-terminal domain-containing protein [Nitrospirota bacterium]
MTVRARPLLLGLLALVLLVVLAFQFFFDPEQFKALLIQQVEEQLGRNIEVSQARFSVFPRIRLELSDVVIRDLDPTRVFFKAKKFDLVLRSTPLLQLRVVIKRVHVEQPEVTLRRDQAGRWNFQSGAASAAVGDHGDRHPLALLLLIQEAQVLEGDVTVRDEFRPGGERALRLHVTDAHLFKDPLEGQTSVTISATLPGEQGVSSLSLTGQLGQEAVAPTQLADDIPTSQRLHFQGDAAFLNLDLRRLADFFGPRPIPSRMHGAANLRGSLSVKPGVKGYDILLNNMQADVGHLMLKGQAGVSGLITGQPTFSLTFASSPIGLDELLKRIPLEWIDTRLQSAIDDHEIRGTVEVASATVTGTVGAEVPPSLTGELHIRDGHALIGTDRTPIEDLAVTVLVEPGRIKATGLIGRYGPLKVTAGKATLVLQEAGPWLELDVPGEIQAADLVAFLNRTLGSQAWVRRLAELREVQGEANLTLRLAGLLNSQEGLRFVGGELEGRHLNFLSPHLPDRVEDVTGLLQFTPASTVFTRVAGRIGPSYVSVDGTIDTEGTVAYRDFVVNVAADTAHMERLLPDIKFVTSAVKGTVEGTVTLSGPTDTPAIKARLDLRDTTIHVPGLIAKTTGTPATAALDTSLGRDQRWTISRVDLNLPPVHLGGKGRLRLGKKFSLDLALVAEPISLAALPKGLEMGGLDAGTLEVTLDVKGKSTNWKTWHYTGWVALTNGLISPKGLEAPLSNVYLRLQLLRNGADVKRLSFKIKDSDFRLSGTLQNWAAPTVQAKGESAQLDLALLIPEGARSPVRTLLEQLAASSHVVLTANVGHGLYKGLAFSDLSTQVSIGNGTVLVDKLAGETYGGHVAGRVAIQLPENKPAALDIALHITNVPYDKLLQAFGDKKLQVAGTFSSRLNLKGHGRDPKGDLHSLNGSADIVVTQGKIQRGRIVPQVLKILNLPALLQGKVDLTNDGLPFDKVSAAFVVKDGVVSSENLVLDSPVLKITGAGSYDLTEDRFDAVVAASPLGSYTKLLQSIPLFGKLFAGEREGFTTALFEVKGTMQDPKVSYMPLQSLATGVAGMAHLAFDLLKNTILLPKNLIAPSDEAQGETPAKDQAPDQAAPAPEPAAP